MQYTFGKENQDNTNRLSDEYQKPSESLNRNLGKEEDSDASNGSFVMVLTKYSYSSLKPFHIAVITIN